MRNRDLIPLARRIASESQSAQVRRAALDLLVIRHDPQLTVTLMRAATGDPAMEVRAHAILLLAGLGAAAPDRPAPVTARV